VIPALKPKLLQSLTVFEIRTKPFFASVELESSILFVWLNRDFDEALFVRQHRKNCEVDITACCSARLPAAQRLQAAARYKACSRSVYARGILAFYNCFSVPIV
jgi:hypothetical protein